jgi:hypothetical protein
MLGRNSQRQFSRVFLRRQEEKSSATSSALTRLRKKENGNSRA